MPRATVAQTITATFNSSTTWTCPAGVTSVVVECWGGGGAGGSARANGGASAYAQGGGGAGGAYAKSTLTVVPNTVYTVTVGAAVAGTSSTSDNVVVNGNPSWFNTTGTIFAQGGAGGVARYTTANALVSGAGGAGSSASSIGTTLFAGGSGGAGQNVNSGRGGGGGSSAGTAANGNAGTSAGAAGAAPTGGAAGGVGGTYQGSGAAGTAPGGGGGGSTSGSTTQYVGGTGAAGQVKISYTCAVNNTTSTAAICNTQTKTLTGTPAGGTFSLVSGNGTVSGSLYTPTSSTSGTVTIRYTVGVCTADASFTVNLSPPTLATITGTTTIACSSTSTLSAPAPTGGTVTTVSGYRIHTFTSNGTFTVPTGFSGNVEVLVVGGGGGGGFRHAGGGGAGGLKYVAAQAVSSSQTVTVGAGGAGNTTGSGNGANGGASSFGALVTVSGGGGGGTNGTAGSAGGSGGGGSNGGAGGAGTAGQGSNGGSHAACCFAYGCGGGGATAAGASTSGAVGSAGGAGFSSSISGSAVTYAGGGGGGKDAAGPGYAGGAGGGGAGGFNTSLTGTNGTANTGGGGGGGGASGGTSGSGGNGGSGIVIVRYPDVTNGTWSSNNTGVATVNPTTGVVSGVAAGTATITYTVTLGTCTSSTSTLVTVTACTPPSISSFTPTSACAGSGAIITISGANFSGATGVTINGVAATFSVTNSTTISATLPAGATGTGNIVVTTPNGSYNSSSIPASFTVNPLPTAGAITLQGTTQTICQGSTITSTNVTAPTNGGSGTLNTVWYVGEFVTGTGYTNWVRNSTTSSALYTATANGTSLSLTNYNPQLDFPGKTDFMIIRRGYTNLCGECVVACADVSFTVTVRPTPTATVSGTTTVCAGAASPNITFTNPTTLPITVTYNINGSGSTTVNVAASSTATVAAPTGTAGTFNYNITNVVYQTAPTCSNTVSGTATVTVIAYPTISQQPQALSICPPNLTAQFNVTAAGGSGTFQWQYLVGATWTNFTNGSQGATGVTTNQLSLNNPLANLGAATYSIRVIVNGTAGGCNTISNAVNFVVYPNVSASVSVVNQTTCNNNTGQVNLTRSGGSSTTYTYLWNTGATTQNLNPIGSGTYTVTVTDGTCTGATATATGTVTAPWSATAGGYQPLCTTPTYLTGGVVGTMPVTTGSTTAASNYMSSYVTDVSNTEVGVTLSGAPAGATITNISFTPSVDVMYDFSYGYFSTCYAYNSWVRMQYWNGSAWVNITSCNAAMSISSFNGQSVNGTVVKIRTVDAGAGTDYVYTDLINVVASYSVPAAITYSWTGPATISNATSANASSTANGGSYSLAVSSNGCTSTIPVTVSNPTVTAPTIATNPSAICFSGTVNLTASGMAPAGKVAQFNGSSSISSTLLNYGNNFTMEFWVNPGGTRTSTAQTTSGISAASGQQYAIVPCSTVGSTDAGAGVSVGTNGISVFENSSSLYLPSLLVSDAPVSGWTHVAVVYINKTPYLYINGSFVKQGLTSTKTNVYPSLGTSWATYGPFTGSIDNIRIWSVSRTQAEIRADMFKDIPGSTTNLVAQYNFDASNLASIGGIGSTLTGAPTSYPDANYYSYTWTTTGGTTPVSSPATNTAASVAVSNGTASDVTYTYKVSAAAGGCTGTLSTGSDVLIRKDPAPPTSGGNVVVCSDAVPATLSVTPPSGYSASWYNSGGTLVQSNSNTFTTSTAGTYSVVSTGVCTSTGATSVTLTVNPVPSAPGISTITQPSCGVATGSVLLTGLPAAAWTVTATPGGATITGSSTSATFSGLTASTTYTFKVTLNSTGCTSVASANAAIGAQPVTPSAPTVGTITQPTCALATATVALSGLPTSAWTVTASPGGATITGSSATANFAGLAASTTYTFTVTLGSSGCTSAASTSAVIAAQPVTPSAPGISTITQPTCALATGSVALTGLPASGTWTLTRSPGAVTSTGSGTTTTVSGLAASTTYSWTVTNASGCTSAASANAVLNAQPTTPTAPVVGTITQPTCVLATASVDLSGLPASGTWTLTRTPGAVTSTGTGTTTTVSGLAASTTYSWTVTSTSGCTSGSSGNAVINAQPPTPSAPVIGTITQPTCALATGSIDLSGLPASGTWTLTRNPGAVTSTGSGTTTTVSSLAPNTYNFTVTNASGCTSAVSSNGTINIQPTTPTAPVVGTITQPTCGTATGSIPLSGLPASGTWTLTRNPGAVTSTGSGTTTTVSGIGAGTYTFTVTNASGCTSGSSGNAVVNSQPTTSAAPVVGTITQPTCALATGSVALSNLPAAAWTVTASPGGATITGSTTTATFSGLAAATTYTFTTTLTSSGCVSAASGNAVINAQPITPAAPTIGTITSPTCALATGSVALSNLPAAAWTVTATPGGATITGSTTTATFSGLTATNSYTFAVTLTSSGCTSAASASAAIPAQPVTPAAPTVGTITSPTCALATGSVALSNLPAAAWTVTASPGGATITGSTTTATFSGLAAATTYTFTTTLTSSGCTSAASANAVMPAQPVTPAAPTVGTITAPTCALATGSVALSNLPAAAYTVTASPGGTTITGSTTTTTFSGLAANATYTFTVTLTSSGCTSAASGSAVMPAQPVTPAAPTVGTITAPTCALATGTVALSNLPAAAWTVTATPGGATITGSTTTANFSGLTAGTTYTFKTTLTSSGCQSAASGNAVMPAQPVTPAAPTVGTITNPTCFVATGSVALSNLPASSWTVTASPGGATITGSATTATFSGLTAGTTYAFTVTLASSGCTSGLSGNAAIAAQPVVPPAPSIGTITQPGCVTSTGTVALSNLPAAAWTVTATPGGATITGSTTTANFSGLAANTTYTFKTTLTSSGCQSVASANAVINAVPTAPSTPVASVTAQPTCAVNSGTITVTSPVGAAYEYAVNGGSYSANPVISLLSSGSYTVTARLAASPDCVSPPAGSYTINNNPTPLTTTPVNVCQGGQGYLTATSVCVDNYVVPAITNSIYGGWLATDATASTPVGAVNSATCSFTGAARTYSVVTFQVSATGNYIFEMNDNATYNGAGYITTGVFTPGSCSGGTLIRVDNDGGVGDEPKLGTPGNPLALIAGVTYSLVSTTDGASNVINNDYTWTITPPAGENILLNEPGTVEWYTASSGGSPIGYGTSFDPVGVPGSGLANTNTQGTTYFYAACSSSPSCRTQAAYTVTTTAPTFNITPAGSSTCYNSSSSVSIGLSGSVSGYPYQIFKDGSSVGMPSPTTGTGGAITLGSVTADGVYTVSVRSGSCDIPMNGNVTIKPVPIADAGSDVSLPCNNIIGLTGASNNTTLFTENFGATTNTQLSPTSTGWRLKYLYGTHPANRTEWWIGYNGGSPYSISCATAGAALATVDNRQYQSDVPCDYAWDAGTMDEIAYNTTPIDARLYTSVNVSFNYVAGGNYSAGVVHDYMQVMYSLDNGASWVAVNAGNNVGTYTLNRQLDGTTNAFFTLTPGTSQTGVANVSMPSAVIGQKFLLGFRWVNDGDLNGDFVGNMMVDNINVTGAASYSWSPTAGVTNSNTSTPTITQAGTYTLVVTAGNGCTASDDVVVGPSPGTVTGIITSADQTGFGAALCADGTRDPNNITFSTPASSGSTYQWYYKDTTGATPVAAPVPGSGTSGWTLQAGATSSSFNPTAYPIAMAGKSRTYACYVTSACATSDWANGSRKVTVDAVFTQNSNPDNCFNIDNTGSNYYVLVNANGGTPGPSGYTWPVAGAVTYGVGGNGSISTNTRIYEFPLAWSGTIPVSDALGCVAAGGNSQTVFITTTQPDDISSAAFVGPGTETAANDCYDLGFDRWITYYDPSEKIIMAINARDNNLGLVNVSMYRNPDEPYILNSATNTDACYLSTVRPMERHFVVTTTNSPNQWGGTNKVGVRLFFTETELQDLITETYGVNGSSNWNTTCATDDDVTTLTDLYVTKYTAPAGQLATEDGDYSNNLPAAAGGLYRIFGAGTTPALGNGPLKHDYLGNFTSLYGGGNAHHYVEMEVEEFSEFWLHGSAHIMPLPVTMLYLEANAINNAYIQIKWATSVEVNNDGFNVERSVDGQTWEKIAFVNGHDNTTQQTVYTYDDLNVTTGVVYYYRLKQVDNDGAFEYTDIVSAKLTGETSFSVKDFIPNPTMDKTKLIITGTKDQEITVTFYNVVGQKMLESNHLVNKGGNMIEFDLAKLASGTYTAVVSSANEVYTKKVVLAK